MSADVRLGIAFLERGMAIDDAGAVFSFSDTAELSDALMWVTDLSMQELTQRYPGLGRFRADTYFYRRLSTIINDLGVGFLSLPDQLRVLHAVLSWAVGVQAMFFPAYAMKRSYIFEPAFVDPARGGLKRRMAGALASATQRYCLLRPDLSPHYHLYDVPSETFHRVMDARVPLSGFRLVDQVEPAQLADAGQDDLCFVAVPAEVVTALADQHVWALAGRERDGVIWLALPEYQALAAQGVHLSVRYGLRATQFGRLQERLSMPLRTARMAVQERLSYSVNLLFDAMLASVMGVGRAQISFTQAYIAALLRVQQLERVRALVVAGVPVHGYGLGRIALGVNPAELPVPVREHLVDTLQSGGMMASVWDLNLPSVQTSGTKAEALLRGFSLSGDSRSFVEFNHHLLEQA